MFLLVQILVVKDADADDGASFRNRKHGNVGSRGTKIATDDGRLEWLLSCFFGFV
jgi:hypothetical protein